MVSYVYSTEWEDIMGSKEEVLMFYLKQQLGSELHSSGLLRSE